MNKHKLVTYVTALVLLLVGLTACAPGFSLKSDTEVHVPPNAAPYPQPQPVLPDKEKQVMVGYRG